MKYVKKIIVDAIQYNGSNREEVIQFTNGQATKHQIYSSMFLNGKDINFGDYIVKTELGFDIQRPNIFEAKHEKFQHKSNFN